MSIEIYDSYEEARDNLHKVDQSNIGQLNLRDSKFKVTIAYDLATRGMFKDEYLTNEVLGIKCTSIGKPVVHILATRGYLKDEHINQETLRMTSNEGGTLAHVLASLGKLPEKHMNKELLKYKTKKSGTTVAHCLASCGKLPELFKTPDIMLMRDDNGRYVFQGSGHTWDIDIDKVRYNENIWLYVLSHKKYNFPEMPYEKFKKLVDSHGFEKMRKLIKLAGKKNE